MGEWSGGKKIKGKEVGGLVWSEGLVVIAQKRNDEEDAKEELYSLVTVTEVLPEGFTGLGTKVIDEED
ncbi:PREDICTED: 60S ribosomal [Prunus dulcis]|uniref:PREDICTED: 60S ribosomal n=1 Tax=Prunus dulcis TaxID=3755 RepID=A0A5E4ESP6_PRUDU|nr:hypothetical protein L3X38_019605 [Prunus dulcis]VVA17621.1 PREDICTED: 60S ribosomal [Prunus dulcis]